MFYLIATGLEPAGSAAENLIVFVQIYHQVLQNEGIWVMEGWKGNMYVYICIYTVIQLQFLLLTKPYIGIEIHESKTHTCEGKL